MRLMQNLNMCSVVIIVNAQETFQTCRMTLINYHYNVTTFHHKKKLT